MSMREHENFGYILAGSVRYCPGYEGGEFRVEGEVMVAKNRHQLEGLGVHFRHQNNVGRCLLETLEAIHPAVDAADAAGDNADNYGSVANTNSSAAPCPMPRAQCPVLSAQCPVPRAQCSVLSAQCSVF